MNQTEEIKEKFYKECCMDGLYADDGVSKYEMETPVLNFIFNALSAQISLIEKVVEEHIKECVPIIPTETDRDFCCADEILAEIKKLK